MSIWKAALFATLWSLVAPAIVITIIVLVFINPLLPLIFLVGGVIVAGWCCIYRSYR